jgi:p24 family protein beta-1
MISNLSNCRRVARLLMASLLTLLLVCLSTATLSTALTTEVRAGETFVITETLPPGTELHFQFALHVDYLMPVFITDRGTNAEVIHWKDRPRGAFSIPASDKARVIAITFDNSDTMFTSKNVNFDVRTPVNTNYAASATELDPIEQKIRVLSSTMHRLKSLQATIRDQQKDHRGTVEDANERVLLWSVFQVVAFIVMSGFQLWLLKRFLEKRTYV